MTVLLELNNKVILATWWQIMKLLMKINIKAKFQILIKDTFLDFVYSYVRIYIITLSHNFFVIKFIIKLENK